MKYEFFHALYRRRCKWYTIDVAAKVATKDPVSLAIKITRYTLWVGIFYLGLLFAADVLVMHYPGVGVFRLMPAKYTIYTFIWYLKRNISQ